MANLETLPDTPANRARRYAAELRERADLVEGHYEIMRYEPGSDEFESALDDIRDARPLLDDDEDDELAAEFGLNQDDDRYWEDEDDQDEGE